MTSIQVAAERLIPAPADQVYAMLADYRDSHPRILPQAFSDFEVLEGGIGSGTRIRFRLSVGGRVREMEAVVAEPEPGRVLTETYTNGGVTSFTVGPAGNQSRLRIETVSEAQRGVTGLVERFLVPRLLGRLYAQELDLIEQWADRLP